jgi:hypothetical protein
MRKRPFVLSLSVGVCFSAARLLACEGRDPNVPEQPEYDERAITRCEHGRDDGQLRYGLQVWRACFNAARFSAGVTPLVALRYAQRSCDLGYAEGCIQYLDFVRALRPRLGQEADEHVTHARELGVKFCRQGLYTFELREFRSGEACHLAGMLHRDLEPKDPGVAKEMFEKGCERGDEGSCKLVASGRGSAE